MRNPNYEFCEELDAPEMCVIMNRNWWQKNRKEIYAWQGYAEGDSMLLFIKNPADRTYFMLKWPQ